MIKVQGGPLKLAFPQLNSYAIEEVTILVAHPVRNMVIPNFSKPLYRVKYKISHFRNCKQYKLEWLVCAKFQKHFENFLFGVFYKLCGHGRGRGFAKNPYWYLIFTKVSFSKMVHNVGVGGKSKNCTKLFTWFMDDPFKRIYFTLIITQ